MDAGKDWEDEVDREFEDEDEEEDVDLVAALKGDGAGGFNERAVRKALRKLSRDDRMRLYVFVSPCAERYIVLTAFPGLQSS